MLIQVPFDRKGSLTIRFGAPERQCARFFWMVLITVVDHIFFSGKTCWAEAAQIAFLQMLFFVMELHVIMPDKGIFASSNYASNKFVFVFQVIVNSH